MEGQEHIMESTDLEHNEAQTASPQRIAILTCLRSNDVCTRAGCLAAFYDRKAFFSEYGADCRLVALMTCNGCHRMREEEPAEDAGMIEKVDRLQSEGVQVVHVGVCRMHHGVECHRITQICGMIQDRGIQVVRGTHRE